MVVVVGILRVEFHGEVLYPCSFPGRSGLQHSLHAVGTGALQGYGGVLILAHLQIGVGSSERDA